MHDWRKKIDKLVHALAVDDVDSPRCELVERLPLGRCDAFPTARLRKLSPRVTSTDLDNLGTMVGELEKVSTNLDVLRSKFGLK